MDLSRRGFLKAGAVGAVGLGLTGLGAAGARGAGKRIPVGLQLYSVRGPLGKDVEGVIAQVAEMGYEGVEFAGYYNKDADEWKKLLDKNGLVCCGSHVRGHELQEKNLEKTIAFHKTLGNTFLIKPSGAGGKTKQSWLDAAKRFNDIAKALEPHGMYTGYHNHASEFKPMDGSCAWEIFFKNTDDRVCQQLDTGNCMGGGGKPCEYLKMFPGRTRTVHLKEHGGPGDVGKGKCPWKDIFRLCETVGGTQWYIVEQERYSQRQPLEAAKQAADFMREMGKLA
jgi:sugar phosphate isomerase/epimerase